MTAHFVIVLKGWIKFRYAGIDDEVVVRAGGTLSQPGGVPHNVVGRSDDMELIEINMPARVCDSRSAGHDCDRPLNMPIGSVRSLARQLLRVASTLTCS